MGGDEIDSEQRPAGQQIGINRFLFFGGIVPSFLSKRNLNTVKKSKNQDNITFVCDECDQPIPSKKKRFSCDVCFSFDLCEECEAITPASSSHQDKFGPDHNLTSY